MGIFSRMFSKTQTPEQIVNRTPTDKLEALVKSSGDENVRFLAAGRLNREGIWQYLALHDPENARSAMRRCRDLQFLAKLCELRPEEEYPIPRGNLTLGALVPATFGSPVILARSVPGDMVV